MKKVLKIEDIIDLFDVNRDTIQSWCKIFKEYLPVEQNRKDNQPREFTEEDLEVLAYINYYWEDDPDIENIKIGLNQEDHTESPFRDFALSCNFLLRDNYSDI